MGRLLSADLVAAACAGLAVATWSRPPPEVVLRRRLGDRRSGSRPHPGRHVARTVLTVLLASGGLAAATLSGAGLSWMIVVLVLVFVGWAAMTLRARRSEAEQRRRTRREITALCDAMAAELAIGAPPAVVLTHAAADWSVMAPVATAGRLGGDVVDAFAAAARLPGAEALRSIGAAWEVSARSGAALSGVLDRLSVTLRADEEALREIDASLGPPRATARLLAVLPIVGLALGTGVGSNPWVVLTGSLAGAACLASGAVLAVAGVFWVEAIARQAET